MPIEETIQRLCEVSPLAVESLRELNNELDRLRDHDALELLDRILERTLTAIDAVAALRR